MGPLDARLDPERAHWTIVVARKVPACIRRGVAALDGMRPANCDLCSTFRQRHCDARPPLRHEALLVMSSPGVGDLTEFF